MVYSDLTARVPHTEILAATVEAVRAWLVTKPDAAELDEHLPACELALAAYVKNQDAQLSALLADGVARLNASDAAACSLDTLTARLQLNLHLWQVTRNALYADAARALTQTANARFDETNGMFCADAADTRLFLTDANARMADAFYAAWHALNIEELRPRAGSVLGQVSDVYEPGQGLYQTVILPDGPRSDTRTLAAYTAAIQMFLTALETTGRGTYLARAQILANFVLARDLANARQTGFDERALCADALTRLFQLSRADVYQTAADVLLRQSDDVPDGIAGARFALALERAFESVMG